MKIGQVMTLLTRLWRQHGNKEIKIVTGHPWNDPRITITGHYSTGDDTITLLSDAYVEPISITPEPTTATSEHVASE